MKSISVFTQSVSYILHPDKNEKTNYLLIFLSHLSTVPCDYGSSSAITEIGWMTVLYIYMYCLGRNIQLWRILFSDKKTYITILNETQITLWY